VVRGVWRPGDTGDVVYDLRGIRRPSFVFILLSASGDQKAESKRCGAK